MSGIEKVLIEMSESLKEITKAINEIRDIQKEDLQNMYDFMGVKKEIELDGIDGIEESDNEERI